MIPKPALSFNDLSEVFREWSNKDVDPYTVETVLMQVIVTKKRPMITERPIE